jgi:hypothetical protein
MALKFLNDGYFAGKVGIGTPSPGAKLEISETGTTGAALYVDTARYGIAVIGDGTSNSQYLLNLQGNGGSTNAMAVQSSGNVGIGTTAPERDVQLKKSNDGGQVRLEVNNSSNTAGSHGVVSIYSGGANSGDPFLHLKTGAVGTDWSVGIDNSDSDKLKISQNFGPGINDFLTVTTSGNVGIGTTSPTHKLDVNGSIRSSNVNGLLIDVSTNFGDNSGGGISILDLGSTRALRILGTSNNGWGNILLNPYGANVGIGTTIPSKKLEVKSSTAYDSTVRLATSAHNWDIQGGEVGYSSTAFALDYDGATFFRAIGTTDARFGGGLSVGTINATPPTGGLYVAGNVGIGTTIPSAKLEVNVGLNSLKISGRNTYVDSSEDATNANIYVTQDGVGDFGQLAGNLVLQARTQGTVYRDIIFAGGLSNGDALMTILGEGNVGIGTTGPLAKLDVNGDIRLPLGSKLYINNSGENITSTINGDLELNSRTELRIKANTGANAGNSLELYTSNSERMRITSDGNVGIGYD